MGYAIRTHPYLCRLRGLATHDFCGWWRAWFRGLWRRIGLQIVQRGQPCSFNPGDDKEESRDNLCTRSAHPACPTALNRCGFGPILRRHTGEEFSLTVCKEKNLTTFAVSQQRTESSNSHYSTPRAHIPHSTSAQKDSGNIHMTWPAVVFIHEIPTSETLNSQLRRENLAMRRQTLSLKAPSAVHLSPTFMKKLIIGPFKIKLKHS